MIKLEEIKFKVGSFYEGRGATFLIYIDARVARRELNETFGFGNWQFSYTVNEDKSVHGVLKIRHENEWLEFHDVGYCDNDYTNQPLKDAVSDATKRCAVQVGIGEELYDAPFLWAGKEMCETKANKKFKKLTPDGEKIIQGNINKWYNSLKNEKN